MHFSLSKQNFGQLIFCAVILFSNCEGRSAEIKSNNMPRILETPANLKEWIQSNGNLIRAEQTFSFRFLENLLAKSVDKNQFISPLSLQISLGMAWNGAKSSTSDSMAAALGWAGMSQAMVSKQMVWLQNAMLHADSNVKMEIANAIFYHKMLKSEPDFLNQNKATYNALVQPLDFSNSKNSLTVINGWANEKTHGKIPIVLDKIEPTDIMAICNAVYFKGEWTQKFESNSTETANFNLYADSNTSHATLHRTTKAAFLHRNDKMDYLDDSTAQWARIPYGNSHFSMVVALPKPGKPLLALTQSLTADSWTQKVSKLEHRYIKFYMPKHTIKVSYENEIKNVLTKMGMGIAFRNQANFTGISKAESVFIGRVVHKSFIETNEKGSEAAAVAVTMMHFSGRSPKAEPIPVLRLNRPYLYAITEKQTGAILFIGIMNNPNPL